MQAAINAPERTVEPAAVVVLNRTVAVFRAPLYGYTPQDRVSVVSRRIGEQIAKGMFGPVTLHKDPVGTVVMNDGHIAFTITTADLDPLSEQTMADASGDAVKTLTLALQEAREVHSAPMLLRATARMVIATGLFAAILWAIRRLYRWLLGRLKIVLRPRLERLAGAGSVYLTEIVAVALRFFIGLIAWAAALFATDLWLTYWLHLFPYTRPWGETLRGQVFSGLATFGRTALQAMPNLLIILFIFFFTRILTQLVRRFFYIVEKGQIRVSETFAETARPTNRIIVAALWLFAVVAAYPYIPGSGTEAFKGVSLFVGLLVSLGSTSVVGQAAGGLILMYSRTLKPGDYVRVGDTEGTVLSLGMLSTKIRTLKNEEVSIPNGVMIGTTTKNYTRLAKEEGVILFTSVTIGYDVPWRQVHAMLLRAADRTEGLRKEPVPFVLQIALSDFYVEYQLNAHIQRPENRIPVLAALHANIQDTFNEFGIQIMSPHYLGDPAKAKVVPKEQWYPAPARQEPEAGPAGKGMAP
jgi:small-conductance mechanosensitive channel